MSQKLLSPEEVEVLRQARRGAQSLVWLVVFLLVGLGMYFLIAHNLETGMAKIGGMMVCLMTAWVMMLFLSGLSKMLANGLLVLFSPQQRRLKEYEKSVED